MAVEEGEELGEQMPVEAALVERQPPRLGHLKNNAGNSELPCGIVFYTAQGD